MIKSQIYRPLLSEVPPRGRERIGVSGFVKLEDHEGRDLVLMVPWHRK